MFFLITFKNKNKLHNLFSSFIVFILLKHCPYLKKKTTPNYRLICLDKYSDVFARRFLLNFRKLLRSILLHKSLHTWEYVLDTIILRQGMPQCVISCACKQSQLIVWKIMIKCFKHFYLDLGNNFDSNISQGYV